MLFRQVGTVDAEPFSRDGPERVGLFRFLRLDNGFFFLPFVAGVDFPSDERAGLVSSSAGFLEAYFRVNTE